MKYNKVIIWGHPLYSHTHSYIHQAFYETFKFLGYDTYWFHNEDYPKDFDYDNTLYIGEGFADQNLPLNNTSCYFIMYCPSPKKYLDSGGRYIDVRMAAKNFKDHIHDYSLDKNKCEKVGLGCYFEKASPIAINYKNNYVDYNIPDFDKFYMSWATNLLPHEFNYEDCRLPRTNKIYFCGNLSNQGVCENMSTFKPFLDKCKSNNIEFVHNNSWANPLSKETVIELTKKSYLAVDIRGPEHLKNELLTCRICKNISYGQLGLTNSWAIYEALEGHCIYDSDTSNLFDLGVQHREDHNFITKCMQYIKDNHTYVNRVQSILKVIE